MSTRARAIGALVLLVGAVAACRDATYVQLELSTDVKCTDLNGTNVAVGQPGEVETLSATTTTKRCESNGEIGNLVIVPSAGKEDRFALKVVAGVGKSPDDCEASGFKGGCIVARRSLRFVPHTALKLPVALALDCLDVPCSALETCLHGQCVSAEIRDAAACAGANGCVLGSGGSGGTGGTGGGGTGGTGTGGVGGSVTGGSGGIGGTGGASCAPPSADCDGSPATCETNLDTSAAHCGACGHSCLGGACVGATCQPVVVATGSGAPRFVAVDSVNLYWTTYAASGAIRKAPLDGSAAASDIATSQPFVATIALDASNVYWSTNESAGGVFRLPKSGGTPTQIAPASKANGLALDASTAYFSESNGSGALAAAPIAGGAKTTLATSVAFPWGLAVDATSVYYAGNTASGGVFKLPKTGGTPLQLAPSKFPYSVAVDASDVFYAETTGAYRVPISGGAATKLGSANDSYAVAIDSTHVFWTDYYGGMVLRAPKAGGPSTTLASGQASPWGITVDGSAVYWANAAPGGAVMKVAKPLP